jgi:uncharacterized membrane protein YphA (DoxX/SURF4 family)
MTLGKLLLYIGIIALILTLAIGFLKKGHKSWVMTFLQNFCGVLFIVSGWVKAVDPMGTAFKMEQYFAEFEATFEGTSAAFMAPMFPWLSEHAIVFSVFMIILEIVVGVLLVIGHRTKLTSWIFLLVIAFFTALTGFTFLTGYVPPGENFFNFSAWGPYASSNMRVTDCGCFGDFIKLEPKTSFFKDVFLLIPALIFVFRHKDMHQLFTKRIGDLITVLLPVGLLVYCVSNFVWNEPHADFRPFRVGVNIAEQKAAEEEAQASVQILAWQLKSKEDGRIVELSNETYMKDFKSYPKEQWEILGQTKSEPAIPETKLSHFDLMDNDGNDVTLDILENPDPVMLILCYKLKGEETYVQETVQDTVYRVDTVTVDDKVYVVKAVDTVEQKVKTVPQYAWNPEFVERFRDQFVPLAESAAQSGITVYGVAGAAAARAIADFKKTVGTDMEILEADDVMLKTIMRSNPGLLLLKDGKILGKWHHRHLPTIEEVQKLTGQ